MAESVRVPLPAPASRPRSTKPPWILSSHLKTTPLRPSSLAAVVLLRHKHSIISTRVGRIRPVTASSIDGASIQEIESAPVAVDLLPICSEDQFHRTVSEAQEAQEPVIVVWMASWCRKCIYLKPKLEKLAAEYHPRLRFFCVDVNKVSHKLVAYAGITKMPVIQLWNNGIKQAEVIGGHKAHLVVNEVHDMIESGS